MTQDLNADLIHYTYKLEFELANTKRKLKFQQKKFKKLIQKYLYIIPEKSNIILIALLNILIQQVSHQKWLTNVLLLYYLLIELKILLYRYQK